MTLPRGRFRVRRLSGLLPPGVTKRIGPFSGWTFLFGLPFGFFRVDGLRLLYKLWPIVDELEQRPDGSFVGRGLVFGLPFCRFALDPLP